MKLNIEQTYQKKTQLEHILLRPDSYIGTVESITDKMWVFDSKTSKLQYKTISYVPGLYKIFDEILVNAVDNITRDLSMSTIKVTLTPSQITIYNNGKGIPIEIHKKENLYVPELIFGHLLTSSNYDDSIKKITGGRNGYGAKLTNVFSKRFVIETADIRNKKHFKMEFTNNMTKHSSPIINTKYKGNEDYTQVTFEPDFKKFNMKELSEDMLSLLMKRVYDVAGTTPQRINVYLNDKKIPINTFSEYVDMYIGDKYFDDVNKVEYPKLAGTPTKRWEVMFSIADSQFKQVSFVNGICTSKGGSHVNYILDQVIDKISEHIKKKHKDIKLNANQIKQNIWVFINCYIDNPSFDSQTKETLTTTQDKFGSSYVLTDKLLKEIIKSNIVNNIVCFAKAKQKVKLHKALSSNIKKSSRLLGIEKLEDANLAGTKDYKECTLILTEGDSAKALALAGIEVVGRDKYGVFPLRGKLLNVRSAKDKQIMQNEEIQNIIKILGLKMGMDYTEELKGMRYGHLLIMTDQDYDGSHIKGLIINFIHFFWPSLLKRGDFLHEFITPIVKATKNGMSDKTFFTIKEYNDWYNLNKHNGYKIKYYKGLGTSTSNEAKEYFHNIRKNKIDFYYMNNEDDNAIELGFCKTDSEARKEWLLSFDQFNTFIDHSKGVVRYKDFINKELIFFSNYDNIRSIPSVMDGLKPSERKILYSCFKRNLKNELKVAQLSGYVAEHSSYHHGEQSLNGTITALAQDFVGSNNLNFLLPIGQFGNRYNGSKGAASARYIFTALNPLTRKVFNEYDDNLLMYNVDEGMKIEPIYYIPILPTVLINGSEGIGTGWSSSVPKYNPIEVAENLMLKMDGKEMKELMPWYKGFNGDVKESVNNSNNNSSGKGKSYVISGSISVLDESEQSVEINELPIETWTRDYKSFLEKNHVDNNNSSGGNSSAASSHNKEFEVEDIKEYHADNRLSFIVKLTKDSYDKVKAMSHEERIKTFKLSTTVSTSNMVLFDSNSKIKKYANVNEIINDFYTVRLDLYTKRKEYLLDKVGFALAKNENKRKFISLVINNEIQFKQYKNKNELIEVLKSKGIATLKELKRKYAKAFQVNSTEVIVDNNSNSNSTNDEDDKDYDYVMNMNLWSLTNDKINELDNAIKKDKEEFDYLNKNTVFDLWKKDLSEFITLYNIVLSELNGKKGEVEKKIKELKAKTKLALGTKRKTKGKATTSTKGKKKVNGGKKKKDDSFLDDDESDDSSDSSDSEMEYSEYSDDDDNKNNKKKVKEDSMEIDNEVVIPEAVGLIKTLQNSGSKKMELPKKGEDVDITKLSLKQRLALRVKQGRIDEYLTARNKKIVIDDDDDEGNDDGERKDELKEVNDILNIGNDKEEEKVLQKKTERSTEKKKKGKGDGGNSSAKKRSAKKVSNNSKNKSAAKSRSNSKKKKMKRKKKDDDDDDDEDDESEFNVSDDDDDDFEL